MSGGGSGGGGGSTGAISYPTYMETFHTALLGTVTASVGTAIDAASGNSPYTSISAYDPDIDVSGMESAISNFSSLASSLDQYIDYGDSVAKAVEQFDSVITPSGTYITNRITAYTDDLNDAINAKLLPTYRAGMRDIGAVMSSAFAIGETIILTDATKQIAKYAADMYFASDQVRINNIEKGVSVMSSMLTSRVEYNRVLAALIIEQKRMKIVAKDDEEKRNTELDVLDAKWDLDLFQYGSNTLAGIAGGTGGTRGNEGRSSSMNALGGALGGAAVGAQVGSAAGPYGTAIGAGVGAVVGYFSAKG
jgi:hypothetical protein